MLLHNGGVDEDNLEHDDEDGHPHDEGDDQANAEVVQKDLEKVASTNHSSYPWHKNHIVASIIAH